MTVGRRGHAAAFEVVYERHATAAYSLAYRMTGSRPQAEDIVQEAFLAVWRSGARYDAARGSVRTWLLGIVHHRGWTPCGAAVPTSAGGSTTRGSRSGC